MHIHKRKLNVDEQIQDMKDKGIAFNIVNEADAAKFLKYRNYYFKLKAYTKNYDIYRATAKAGQFINLEFAYLQEISTIDMHFRKLIIDLSLDVEHALKVKLLNDLVRNDEEDGYQVVQAFFDADTHGGRIQRVSDKADKSFISDLVKNHLDNDKDYALWGIVEILSFGDFIDLYELYYQWYPSAEETYVSFLWSIKFIRNAAAHNNCLLNSLKKPYSRKFVKTKELVSLFTKIKIDSETRNNWLDNPVIHDFLALVYVYVSVIKSDSMRKRGIERIRDLFEGRMKRHPEYFEKNNTLTSAYIFVHKTVSYFCNKYGR